MKTRNHIPAAALLGLFLMSCASSTPVSRTSSWNDEIYGPPAKPQASQLAKDEGQGGIPEKKAASRHASLEQRYSDVIAEADSSEDYSKRYSAEETSPYDRVLSDSYEESYERRLRGFSDPYYRMGSWPAYHSDDYWYAQSYDPYFYNVIVMGNQVWVEPRYISAMFGWPRAYFGIGIGFGWGWGYYGYRYNPYGWYNPYGYYDYYGYSPWYNNGYWWGWNNGYWAGNSSANLSNNHYYGRRGNGASSYTARRTGLGTTTNGGQTEVARRRDGTSGTNPVVSTRRTQTRVAPTYESGGRRGTNGSGQVSSSETRRATEASGTRRVSSERPTRGIGVSEPTRRTYNQPGGNRTRTTTDYSARRNGGTQSGSSVSGAGRTSPGNRNATPTYNRPERVSAPSSSTSRRSNDSYRPSSSGSNRSSSSGSSFSGPGSRSSGSSGSSSSSSSSGSSARRR